MTGKPSPVRAMASAAWEFIRARVNVVRLARYSVASIAASLVSAVILATGNVPMGTRDATIAAFVAGAAVAFVINRFWAWRRSDKRVYGREFLRYWLVAVGAALIALGGTSGMHALLHGSRIPQAWQTVLVMCAYFGSYALTFVAKYLLLGRFVFGTSARTAPARTAPARTARRPAAAGAAGTDTAPTVSDVVAEVESGA